MSLSRLVPNILTVLALCSGLTGVRYAFQENWEFATGAIAIAAVLDTLDGRMARLLKGQSKFGAELDSLADIISFGVAPALILFLWATNEVERLGWMAALFFATCMALRLARFNTKLEEPDRPPFASRFFSGVPAPAAAGLAMLPLILSFVLPDVPVRQPVAVSVWMVVVGLLMVSQIPTYSFKGVRLPQRFVLPTLVVMVVVVASLASVPWQTLAGIIITYAITIPISIRSHFRLTRLHQQSAPNSDPADG
jgi:CDP-diacylglycerol---serine O-phosphatidyltransferase